MAPHDSKGPDSTRRRDCQFALWTIFVVAAVVAVVVAAVSGAFGATASELTWDLFVAAPFAAFTMLIVFYVFMPLAAFIFRLESSTLRRRRRRLRRGSSREPPRNSRSGRPTNTDDDHPQLDN